LQRLWSTLNSAREKNYENPLSSMRQREEKSSKLGFFKGKIDRFLEPSSFKIIE